MIYSNNTQLLRKLAKYMNAYQKWTMTFDLYKGTHGYSVFIGQTKIKKYDYGNFLASVKSGGSAERATPEHVHT